MHVRQASLADRTQLARLIERETGPRDDIEGSLTALIEHDSSNIIILTDSGRIIGCCGYTTDKEDITGRILIDRWQSAVDEETAMLLYGVVHNNWQGRGWGTQLANQAKQEAQRYCATVIGIAWCHTDRPNGADLLEAIGLDRYDEEPLYWTRHTQESVACPVCTDACACDAAFYATHDSFSRIVEE